MLWASFLLVTPLLGAMVVRYWLGHGRPEQAVVRATLVGAIMAAAHVFGYRLYQRQPIAWSPRYHDAIVFAGVLQIPSTFFASLMLDGGFLMYSCFLGALGTWFGAALIVCRRPESPTDDDLAFIRWTFLPLSGIASSLILTMPRLTPHF